MSRPIMPPPPPPPPPPARKKSNPFQKTSSKTTTSPRPDDITPNDTAIEASSSIPENSTSAKLDPISEKRVSPTTTTNQPRFLTAGGGSSSAMKLFNNKSDRDLEEEEDITNFLKVSAAAVAASNKPKEIPQPPEVIITPPEITKTEEELAEEFANQHLQDFIDDDAEEGGVLFEDDGGEGNEGEEDDGEDYDEDEYRDSSGMAMSVRMDALPSDSKASFSILPIPHFTRTYVATEMSRAKTDEYLKVVKATSNNTTQINEYFTTVKSCNVAGLEAIEMYHPNCIYAKDSAQNTVFHTCCEVPNSLQTLQHLGTVLDRSIFSNSFYSIFSNSFYSATTSTTPPPQKEVALKLLYEATGREYNSNSSDNTIPTATSLLLKSGWLFKHKDGHTPKKRWCRLYASHLVYYASPDDVLIGAQPKGTVPLDGCSIRQIAPMIEPKTIAVKIAKLVTTFEIIIASEKAESKRTSFLGGLMGKTKKTEQMKFQASTELESIEWITILRAITANIEVADIHSKPVKFYTNLDVRRIVLNQGNTKGETPLHVMARSELNNNESVTDENKVDLIQVIHWLLSSGCDPSLGKKDGATASETAYNIDNGEMESWLLDITKRLGRETPAATAGGTVTTTGSNTANSSHHNTSSTRDKEPVLKTGIWHSFPLLLPSLQFPGYSYVTLQFHKQGFTPTARETAKLEVFEFLTLTVAVYNQRRQLIEPIQQVPEPLYRRRRFVYWADCVYFQLPLECMSDKASIEFTLQGVPYGATGTNNSLAGSRHSTSRTGTTTGGGVNNSPDKKLKKNISDKNLDLVSNKSSTTASSNNSIFRMSSSSSESTNTGGSGGGSSTNGNGYLTNIAAYEAKGTLPIDLTKFASGVYDVDMMNANTTAAGTSASTATASGTLNNDSINHTRLNFTVHIVRKFL